MDFSYSEIKNFTAKSLKTVSWAITCRIQVKLFPEYQFSLKSSDKIIGVANCLPFFWDKSFEELPERGWDWVFEKGINDKLNDIKANTLNGLQIAVNKECQGKGISSIILKEMVSVARDNGFKYITIPVRPSLKSKYPLIPIDHYIKWKREDSLPYDPWLRVHIRMGVSLPTLFDRRFLRLFDREGE